eukprot:TRINITY_DN1233_c0_g1_i3.p2 TRINITY_DN1233_c0_g1~~TRINITY_DN1233_c0_g1_i3.p2  ORF type:complete len:185 (-),score=15.47 TRINITY_DN1233_c0_g1_i3:340-822(-)
MASFCLFVCLFKKYGTTVTSQKCSWKECFFLGRNLVTVTKFNLNVTIKYQEPVVSYSYTDENAERGDKMLVTIMQSETHCGIVVSYCKFNVQNSFAKLFQSTSRMYLRFQGKTPLPPIYGSEKVAQSDLTPTPTEAPSFKGFLDIFRQYLPDNESADGGR